jgi:serine/threonine-protein kinase
MKLEQATLIGGYRVDGVLGQGGMAVVYRAHQVELGREVALKVLAEELSSNPEFAERFRREGRMQASLEHPHAVTVYEAGESEHGLYLAMQLVPGPTLAQLIEERALSATKALSLLRQVGDALDAVHAAGLVHRDVKPQNVLVGDDGDAYLGDFGLVRIGGATGITADGRLVGTIPYLAPELIRGEEAVPASDMYAFAATIFECLAGTVIYPRRSEAAMLAAHSSEPPPKISKRRRGLPAALDEVFARALAKDPARRYTSARGLVDEVGRVLEAAGVEQLGPPEPAAAVLDATTVEPEVQPRPAAGRERRRVLPLLALAALVGAAAALGVRSLVAGDHKTADAAVPAPLQGMRVLGSDLSEPGRTLDCRGRTPRATSTSCAVLQSALPGRTLVVPQDGVIGRWAVRSMHGELSLAVFRPHSNGFTQVSRSPNEFAENDGPFAFDADLPVQRGDLVGLVAVEGSGLGVRPGVKGATTSRWLPNIHGNERPTLGAGTGFDNELLLRVEYLPGGQQRLPAQLRGAAAAALPSGRVKDRRRLRYADGPPAEIDLVDLGGRYVLDQFVRGRRTARIDVPGFFPGHGDIITFDAYAEDAGSGLGIYLEYVTTNSARVLNHFYAAFPNELDFIN